MSYTSTRVASTNPTPYDQAFIISQDTINDAFNYLYDNNANDESPMKHFKYSFHGQSIDMKLDASTIQLQVINPTPQLYFMINVISGTLNVWASEKDDDTTPFPMDGWILGFPVDMSKADIASDDPRYQEYGVDPSVFTLMQLFLTSSTTTSFSEELSNFQGSEIENNATAMSNFQFFMTQWLNSMQNNNQTVLGYGKTLTPTGKDDTTYPPTSLDYYVYPWKGETSSSAPQNNSPDNCLGYLMMSDHRPNPFPKGIPYSGPFTEAGAAYCMNTAIFWDSWIVPLLNLLNQGAELYPKKPIIDSDDNTVALDLGVGNDPNFPSQGYAFFDFKPDGPGSWSWTGVPEPKKNSGKLNGLDMDASETATNTSKLTFEPGNNILAINGTNELIWTIGYRGMKPAVFTFDTAWTYKLQIDAVKDGGLQITKVTIDNPATTKPSFEAGDITFPDLDDYLEELGKSINDYMILALNWYEDDFFTTFKSQHQLVLPASGTFTMFNPFFNDRGDLLVDLWYSGTHRHDPGHGDEIVKPPRRSADSTFVTTPNGREKVADLLARRPARMEPKKDTVPKERKKLALPTIRPNPKE